MAIDPAANPCFDAGGSAAGCAANEGVETCWQGAARSAPDGDWSIAARLQRPPPWFMAISPIPIALYCDR